MMDNELFRYPRNSLRACLNTEENIGLVNLPVKVSAGWGGRIQSE